MKRLSIAFAIAVPACVAQSPSTSTEDQAIIGGQSASTTEFPTVVDLEHTPGDWFCTGTLIDKDWVLTAAHCVEGESATALHIRFDDNNINDTAGGKVVAVSAIHAHPGFNEQAWDNDIAVIKLAQSVTDRTPTPIHRTSLQPGTMVTEVGYGDADNNGGGAGVLRKLTVPTVDCAQAGDPGISNANLLCFNASSGKSSCYGDSGGPAYIKVGTTLEVAGVTSGGTGNTCTQGWDLYTSVPGELAFVDMYVPHGADPMDPGDGGGSGSGGNPDDGGGPGPDPQPDPNDPSGGTTTVGGCHASGGNAGLLFVAAATMLAARRRRRVTP